MPSASENASEIAIVRIPAITASFNEVAAFSPIITPSVVMTPEVSPNAIPVLWEGFMFGGAKFGLRVFGYLFLVFGRVKPLVSRLVLPCYFMLVCLINV